MNILILTLPVSLLLATLFVVLFIKSTQKEQFDDLETPAYLALLDEIKKDETKKEQKK